MPRPIAPSDFFVGMHASCSLQLRKDFSALRTLADTPVGTMHLSA